jgi:hypothetical protein
MHWKYVSLFAKNDDNTNFKEVMVKVLKLAEAKKNKRETEMMEADLEGSNSEVEGEGADDKIFKKNVPKVDTFFLEDTGVETEKKTVEKRAVMRDGRIPKLAKNFEKLQAVKMAKDEGWHADDAQHQREQQIAAWKPPAVKEWTPPVEMYPE